MHPLGSVLDLGGDGGCRESGYGDRQGRSRYPSAVSTRIIVPHRGLEAAKTRLATSLSPDERMFLASQLLQRVLRVAREVTEDVVVISPSRPLIEVVEPSG